LEQARVAPVGTMNDLVPAQLNDVRSEIDDPEVREARCDHDSGQTARIRKVALVKMKASTLPVREQGFYFEPPLIIAAGFLGRGHVRNQMDRVLAGVTPPSDGKNRSYSTLVKDALGTTKRSPGFTCSTTSSKRSSSPPSHRNVAVLLVRRTYSQLHRFTKAWRSTPSISPSPSTTTQHPGGTRVFAKKTGEWWIGWLIDLPGVNARESCPHSFHRLSIRHRLHELECGICCRALVPAYAIIPCLSKRGQP
jgi:hypothetical protein